MIYSNEFCNFLIEKFKNEYFIYKNSFHQKDDSLFFLARSGNKKNLFEVSTTKDFLLSNIKEKVIEVSFFNEALYLGVIENNIENSKKILSIFPELKPSRMDKKLSVGFGDRIGIAAAAHVRASQKYDFFPLFAQQSAREITKTSRDCETVLHNAVIGVFQEGYRSSWGADADHLRDEKWLKIMLDNSYVPYSMFTIDTYEYINLKEDPSDSYLDDIHFQERFKRAKKYIGKCFNFAGQRFEFTADNILFIVKRYYKSIDFLTKCFNLIKNKIDRFDFEPTFDEREVETTPLEHFYIASELISEGITFSTIAPKFPGLFEKGIDYIGNLKNFIGALKIHGEIAKYFGNYRLSFHSADDKYKIFKYFHELLGDCFHVKTSGTTWMESLRTVAVFNPDLFKKIIEIVLVGAEENSKDYHITLDFKKINKDLQKKDPAQLIDIKETRQLLHVSYGTVLSEYRKEIVETLFNYEEEYMKNIIKNYSKHFKAIFLR
jgi:hypothetical protein